MLEHTAEWPQPRVIEMPSPMGRKLEMAGAALSGLPNIRRYELNESGGIVREVDVPIQELKIADFPEDLVRGVVLVGQADYLKGLRINSKRKRSSDYLKIFGGEFAEIYDGNNDTLTEIYVSSRKTDLKPEAYYGKPRHLMQYRNYHGSLPERLPHGQSEYGGNGACRTILTAGAYVHRVLHETYSWQYADLRLILCGVNVTYPCNPNNPNGNRYTYQDIKYFAPTETAIPEDVVLGLA